VFTGEELLRAVWGGAYGRSRTVDSHAYRLRRRLEDAGGDGLLRDILGVGYKLIDA
jgi:two-component system response regulator AdeR